MAFAGAGDGAGPCVGARACTCACAGAAATAAGAGIFPPPLSSSTSSWPLLLPLPLYAAPSLALLPAVLLPGAAPGQLGNTTLRVSNQLLLFIMLVIVLAVLLLGIPLLTIWFLCWVASGASWSMLRMKTMKLQLLAEPRPQRHCLVLPLALVLALVAQLWS